GCACAGPVLGPGRGPFALSGQRGGDRKRHRHHRAAGNRHAYPGLCAPRRRDPVRPMSAATPTGHGMLMTTVPTRADAIRIADMLVGERLAACVQMLPVESVYVWDGKKQNEAEILLLVKTRASLFEAAIARIRAVHPY